jgi:bifunctional ADP-heptose synthase (sugar kinase/adenylyltransferase)
MTELSSIQQPKKFKILLLGDDCIDVYQYGVVDRISPEAPVPVFKFEYEERKAGMAGNVKNNLESLGCEVHYLYNATSIKTRLIDKRSNQHIARIDNDVMAQPIELTTTIPQLYDAVVISDYNKGSVTYELIEELRKEFQGPIFVDTKKQYLDRFDGCVVKINELEYKNRYTVNDKLIVTLGSKGAMLMEGFNGKMFSAVESEVVDVTGAGDTFLASLVYQYMLKSNLDEAILFAIKASSITVQHMGVYAPTLEEICD